MPSHQSETCLEPSKSIHDGTHAVGTALQGETIETRALTLLLKYITVSNNLSITEKHSKFRRRDTSTLFKCEISYLFESEFLLYLEITS